MPNNYYENLGKSETNPENIPQEKVTPYVPPAPSEDTQEITPNNSTELQQEDTNIENLEPQSEPNSPSNSTGQLTVSVSAANELYPVVGATVVVRAENSENSDALDSSTTDRSGVAKTFTLPAPSASASQEPTAAIPYAQYRVTITSPDFFDAIIENVQVFGGILTQLSVNLIPLPELPNGETSKIVIIPRQNL